MERFAKRKVVILPGRSGNKLVWFEHDDKTKTFIGEFSSYMDNDSICEDVKRVFNINKCQGGKV